MPLPVPVNPRLLVVDDAQAIGFALSEYFAARGYQVDQAAGLQEAAALIHKGEYQVLLTDLSLNERGGMEGLQLAAMARLRHPHIRTVILTAYGSAKSESWAQRLGVDAFLHKPTPLAEIANLLERLLREPPSHPSDPSAALHGPVARGPC